MSVESAVRGPDNFIKAAEKGSSRRLWLYEKTAQIVFFCAAAAAVIALSLISVFLFANGLPAIAKIGAGGFIFGRDWSPVDEPPVFGILPMIASSMIVTLGAALIGAPIGTLSAVFLSHICPKAWYRTLKSGVELMAAVPSVVYGFFGMAAITPLTGYSLLSASILLGIMILPTITAISESTLRAVPAAYYESARALGAGRYRAIFFAALPAAKSGVLASFVLGIGRAVGETMAVIMVAGNQARLPTSIFKGGRTLTANIVIEMGYAAELHREALIATGAVLFIFILIINSLFWTITRRMKP